MVREKRIMIFDKFLNLCQEQNYTISDSMKKWIENYVMRKNIDGFIFEDFLEIAELILINTDGGNVKDIVFYIINRCSDSIIY